MMDLDYFDWNSHAYGRFQVIYPEKSTMLILYSLQKNVLVNSS